MGDSVQNTGANSGFDALCWHWQVTASLLSAAWLRQRLALALARMPVQFQGFHVAAGEYLVCTPRLTCKGRHPRVPATAIQLPSNCHRLPPKPMSQSAAVVAPIASQYASSPTTLPLCSTSTPYLLIYPASRLHPQSALATPTPSPPIIRLLSPSSNAASVTVSASRINLGLQLNPAKVQLNPVLPRQASRKRIMSTPDCQSTPNPPVLGSHQC